MRFEGKVAIVTGSARGIGREVLLRLANEGAAVVVNDVDAEAAENTLAEVRANGGTGIVAVADVSNRKQVREMVEMTVDKLGTVDILINNAGIVVPELLWETTEEQWDSVINVHLKGTFNCMQAVVPIFMERAKQHPDAKSNGKIVNVSSRVALRGELYMSNYGAAKAGIIGLTMTAARELGQFRVQVNAIAFSRVRTRLTLTGHAYIAASEDKYAKGIPLGYVADPEDVAPAVVFLAGSDANYITGITLNVSGGAHIAV